MKCNKHFFDVLMVLSDCGFDKQVCVDTILGMENDYSFAESLSDAYDTFLEISDPDNDELPCCEAMSGPTEEQVHQLITDYFAGFNK